MTLYDEQDYDAPDRYQEEIERTERERREFGSDVPGGWARPADPACPQHGYGMPDERGCGMCLQEASARREAA